MRKMRLTEKFWRIQRRIEDRFQMIGKGKYSRILKMARKPTPEEYKKVITITGLGMLIIGALGFVIYIILSIIIKIP